MDDHLEQIHDAQLVKHAESVCVREFDAWWAEMPENVRDEPGASDAIRMAFDRGFGFGYREGAIAVKAMVRQAFNDASDN